MKMKKRNKNKYGPPFSSLTQGSSGTTPITLSKDLSVEILTGVWLHHGKLCWIEVFLLWKTEYLDDCITAMRCVASKVAAVMNSSP